MSTNIKKKMSEDKMTDLERFQAKANSVTDSSLESTRRMMSMVTEVRPVVKDLNGGLRECF